MYNQAVAAMKSKQHLHVPPQLSYRMNKILYILQRFRSEDEVFIDEVSDGNLNEVLRLYTKDANNKQKQSLIVKHAVPYIKVYNYMVVQQFNSGFSLLLEKL